MKNKAPLNTYSHLQLAGLLWTSNRRIWKAYNRRKSSRGQTNPYRPNKAESTFGTSSTPKPFIYVNSPRSFSSSPIRSSFSPTPPYIFVNPTVTPSSRSTMPFIHISPRQNRLPAHKRNPYIIVNPRAEAGGRSQAKKKMLRNPNLNSMPRSIPNSYLPMTSNGDPLVNTGFLLPLFFLIYSAS